MNRVMYRSQDYVDNIENRLRKNQRYRKSADRVNAAYRNRKDDPVEYDRAYRENGRLYNNTAYSRNTYMGLSNG